MRGDSSRGDFAVYEFDDAEGEVEVASGKYMKRFEPRVKAEEQMGKEAFLQAFSFSSSLFQRDISEARKELRSKGNAVNTCVINTSGRQPAFLEATSSIGDLAVSMSNHQHLLPDAYELSIVVDADPSSTGASELLTIVGDNENPQLSYNLVSRMPNNEEKLSSTSESQSLWDSDLSQDKGSLESEQDYVDGHSIFLKTEDSYTEVVVCPDYVSYGEMIYYEEARLIFYADRVIVEFSDEQEKDEKMVFKFSISDLVRIVCFWNDNVEVARVSILLRPSSASKISRALDVSVTERLEAAVSYIHWAEKEKKIMSLSARYSDILEVLHLDDFGREDAFEGRCLQCSLEHLKEFLEPFEDVVYPKGDPDAVSISGRDIELLQPDSFINDTIIDFYIKYLKNRIPPSLRHKYHFFNSFFFRKLADIDKNPGCSSDGRAAFLRVHKWTRKVDLFQKDFIFIPVNFNLHWSLLVICHPGDLKELDDVSEESPKVPCILHMDSISGSHNGLKNIIQSYLCEEWKEKHPDSSEEYSSKFLNMRFVSLEVPQQDNSYDCGLFLLHFVELFLEAAPCNFNPFIIGKFSSFLNVDWFLPAEASQKRNFIRKLIHELLNGDGQFSPEFANKGMETETDEQFDGRKEAFDNCYIFSDENVEYVTSINQLGVSKLDVKEVPDLLRLCETGARCSQFECLKHNSDKKGERGDHFQSCRRLNSLAQKSTETEELRVACDVDEGHHKVFFINPRSSNVFPDIEPVIEAPTSQEYDEIRDFFNESSQGGDDVVVQTNEDLETHASTSNCSNSCVPESPVSSYCEKSESLANDSKARAEYADIEITNVSKMEDCSTEVVIAGNTVLSVDYDVRVGDQNGECPTREVDNFARQEVLEAGVEDERRESGRLVDGLDVRVEDRVGDCFDPDENLLQRSCQQVDVGSPSHGNETRAMKRSADSVVNKTRGRLNKRRKQTGGRDGRRRTRKSERVHVA